MGDNGLSGWICIGQLVSWILKIKKYKKKKKKVGFEIGNFILFFSVFRLNLWE